jgi:hypothetical protein
MKLKLILIAFVFVSFATPVTNDYKKDFGNNYTHATQWLQLNSTGFEQAASLFNIPVRNLKAIVFPELIRYNTVYDAIEINSLKYLYVSEGKDYADFSVGNFQMKPSFAEMVEQDANQYLDEDFLQLSGFDKLKGLADNEDNRKERIARITSAQQQLIYLCAFYKICDTKFADKVFASVNEKVKFYAACYNAGYWRSYESLLAVQAKNYFHTGKFFTTANYNYAAISNYYFEQEK